MADGDRSALGLSVGATNLAAVTADRSVTRKPVLTLYRQRPPEVGVPSENPKLTEPGLVITDFVDRVGSSAGIAAADGTTHRSETLVADALRALAYTATDGAPLPDAVAVTHPAHWSPSAVDALRVALSRVSEWSGGQLVLLPDYVAALVALQANPGVPNGGTVAVCDFGGSGTTLTLVDAANGYDAIATPVRHAEFSGDRIDQALLTRVVADMSSAGSFDTAATSAIGSLNRLRTACRSAKERLSSSIATKLTAEVPGYRGEIQLTRSELDDAIREPLDGFIRIFHDTLQRNGIRAEELVAIASVGGGANIPLVTTTLSERLGALVITAPRPHLTAALGAALRAAHGPDAGLTGLAPTALGSIVDATTRSALDAATRAEMAVDPGPAPALAWSEADDDSGIMPMQADEYSDVASSAPLAPSRRPSDFSLDSPPDSVGDAWYRRPIVVAVGTALAVLAIGSGVLIAMRHTSSSSTPNTPTTSVVPTPANPETSPTETQTPVAPQPAETTPPSTTTEPPTTTTTTTQAPTTTTTTSQPPTTTSQQPQWPNRPRFPDRPRLFPLPGQGGYR